jgi:DNA polymerase-3 subunit delta'
VTVEREGASIDVRQARRITALASMSPVEGKRKVLVLTDFHLVEEAAPALLKTIEEPPGPTVFVVLAEHVPADLVTIASRAVRVDFGPVPTEQVIAALVAGGIDPATAAEVGAASAGRLDRARLLASDPGFAERRRAWLDAPARLDGTGAAVAALAAELLAAIDSVLEPLRERQAAEAASWPGSRTELEARHKREQRRVRTDELRFGLATLAEAYRDRLAAATGPAARQALAALDALAAANEALARNPNEPLLLQNLLLHLT